MEMIASYFPLCWLKNHPQQLPASKPFLQQNLIFFFVVQFFTFANMIPASEAVVQVIANILFILLFVGVLLSLNQSLHTYLQISTAIVFCSNVISLAAIPTIAWLTVTHDTLSYVALVIVSGWYFAVMSYIMKKVLLINIWASSVIALLYFVLTYGASYSFTLAF